MWEATRQRNNRGMAAERIRGRRAAAVRVIAALALLPFSFIFVFVAADAGGVVAVEAVGSPDDPPPSEAAREGAAAPGEAVHVAGALAVVAIGATGLVAQLIRPSRAGSSYHVLSAAVGLLAAGLIVGNPDNFGGQAGAIDPALVVLAVPALVAGLLAAHRHDHGERMLARPLLVFAAIGVVPLLAYGVDQALMQRNTFPPSADPHHQAHWFAMATFAFVVVLAVATAAAGAAGWRLAAIEASVATIVVAGVSVAMPDAASSLGRLGGVAALLWAAGVLVVTARSRRAAAMAT